MRWVGVVLAVLLAIPLVSLGPHGTIVAAKTALFVPEIFPDAPLKPLRWITNPSHLEHSTLSYPGGSARIKTYVPDQRGPHGAVVLMLGARPLDLDDPLIHDFADGLSRLGVVVMVPASDGLVEGQITRDEVDLLVRELQLLRSRLDVDPDRVGFIGLSVGASLSLVAAADPRIAEDVSFVNAFGGYYDARDLFIAVASQSLAYASEPVPWVPTPLTRELMVENLASSLASPDDGEVLRQVAGAPRDVHLTDIEELPPGTRAAVELLLAPTAPEAERLVASLPPQVTSRLDAISPKGVLPRIKADVLIMHDLHDRYVPYTESRRLAEALPAERLRARTELELFDHVMPGQSSDPASFVHELAELARHVYLTCLEML